MMRPMRPLPAPLVVALIAIACSEHGSWTPIVLETDPQVVPTSLPEMAIRGLRFEPGATALWNGREQATAFVSDTELRVKLDSAATQTSGTAILAVQNPGTSPSAALKVTISSPHVEYLFPASVPAGSAGFELSIGGSGFAPDSKVLWNGVPLQAAQSGNDLLKAQVPANAVAVNGSSTVQVVTDFPCRNRSAGCMEQSNTVEFIVGGVVPGIGMRVVDTVPTAIAWDPIHQRLWIATADHTLFSIDPRQRDFAKSPPITFRWDISALAVSDDGAFLYAASMAPSVTRFDLPAMTKTELNPDGIGIIEDLKVAPGAPHTLAISFLGGVVISDDAVVRPARFVFGSDVPSVTWIFGATKVFAATRGGDAFILSVDGNGAIDMGRHSSVGNAFYPEPVARRVYSDSVGIYDENLQWVGMSPVRGPAAPDGALGKLFFVDDTSEGPIHSTPINGNSGSPSTLARPSASWSDVPTRLLRWGQNGLALSTRVKVYVYSGPFVQ